MKPGDPEASCGAQASGGGRLWYLVPRQCAGRPEGSIPWCPPSCHLSSKQRPESGIYEGWSVPWGLLGCGILSRSLFLATSLQAPIQ